MRRIALLLLALLLLTACQPSSQAPPLTGMVQPQDKYRTFYEIYVGSYYDSNGDGSGDLNGILEKMDYLNDNRAASTTSLHVTGVWLMPICPSPTYHKYDVTDYYAVDAAYGTLDDFDALAQACADRGITLILDLVLNHSSSEHPWFVAACQALANGTDSPYVGWYNFSQTPGADYYAVPGADGWYYEGAFWSGMPDLNLDNESLRQEILDICAFWLSHGANGFRLDAVTEYYNGNPAKNTAFLQWLKAELTAIDPEVYIVGEAWTDGSTMLTLYESGIDSLFNFPFAQSTGKIISNVRSGNGADLASALETWYNQLAEVSPTAIDAPFLTNHDMARSSGALMGNLAMQKQAAAVYLLLPGNPFIYYGEEIGMQGGSEKDEDKRMPFVWSTQSTQGEANPPPYSTNKTRVAQGLAEQLQDPNSLARYYVEVINLRNANPTIARGSYTSIPTGEKSVCAYTITWQDTTLHLYHNVGKEPVTITVDGQLHATLSATGENPSLTGGTLKLPAYSTAILTP